MAASLQVIDFGLAAFDPRLAAAAGGYESEVCTAVLLLQPGGLCSSAGQLGKGLQWPETAETAGSHMVVEGCAPGPRLVCVHAHRA